MQHEAMIDHQTIFNIKNQDHFEAVTMEVFKYQYEHNPVYRSYCDLLFIHPSEVNSIQNIPFLPIQFFKSHQVVTGTPTVEKVFESSGTTGSVPSKHFVSDLHLYQQSFRTCFEYFYGKVQQYAILALLPSYLERKQASLVYMVDDLITNSEQPESAFFLDDFDALYNSILSLESKNQKSILLGVSFALLDFLASYKLDLKHTIIMETGGMKGRGKELIRDALHNKLKTGFGVSQVHSEYGMTELLSQAYASANGHFKTPPWMSVFVRNPEDPFSLLPVGKTGGLNIIDLANINSCAFIETQDLGKLHPNGSFEVLGRFDHSEIRGCNLMAL